MEKDYIVFDTETTGLNPKDCRVIEIGAMKYHDHRLVSTFSEYINPECDIPAFITNINGIDNDLVAQCDPIDPVLQRFLQWIEDYPLVGHNIRFDLSMLNAEAKRCGLKPIMNKAIDTVTLSRICFQNLPNHKLETIKNYLGMTVTSHRALEDVKVTAAIYQIYYQRFAQ